MSAVRKLTPYETGHDTRSVLDRLAVSLFRLMRLWELETSRHIDGVPSPGRRHVVRAFTLSAGNVSATELCELLHVGMSTACRLLEAARRDGLVVDRPSWRDGRYVPVELTRQGQLLLDDTLGADRVVLGRATARWSPELQQEIAENVELLRARLDVRRPPP